jgi:hypothetical protein
VPRTINTKTAGTTNGGNLDSSLLPSGNKTTETLDAFRNARRSAPDQGKPQAAERIKICARMRKIRVPELQGEEASTLHAAKKPLLLLLWHSLQDGIHLARAPPEAGRSACAGGWSQCASSPLSSPTFSACVLLITRDGLPLFVLSLSALSLSTPPPPLLASPGCFLSLFGHSGSPPR